MTTAPSAADDLEIECRGLVRIYQRQGVEVQALQGLDLEVRRGELTAIVGASGSGKSTLLGILSGLDRPTAGTARVGGRDLLALSGAGRTGFRRRTAGFVRQQTAQNLVPYLTAEQNIELALAVARAPRRTRRARATELLELLDVGGVAARVPARMSGGQQQRVAIAVGLANAPRVLFADEPTGELDRENSARVLEALRLVNTELGVTVLVVTHDPDVSQHVRRAVRIRDGRISTEVLRDLDADVADARAAREYAVLDRAGRLQLPAEYLDALDLRERVRLRLEADRIEVRRADDDRADSSSRGDDGPHGGRA